MLRQKAHDRGVTDSSTLGMWTESLATDGYGGSIVAGAAVMLAAVSRTVGKRPEDLVPDDIKVYAAERGLAEGSVYVVASRLKNFRHWLTTGYTPKGKRKSTTADLSTFVAWMVDGEAINGETVRHPMSERTADHYAHHVAKLARTAGVHPNRITAAHVRAYLADTVSTKTGNKLTQNVKNQVILAVRYYARHAGIADPTGTIPYVKAIKGKGGKAISDAALSATLGDALQRGDRDAVTCIVLAAFAGLRACEIGRMRAEHITPIWEGDRVGGALVGALVGVIDGKGGYEREVPLDKEAAALLTLGLWTPDGVGKLFPRIKDEKKSAGAAISMRFRAIAKRCEVTNANTHAYRHWFAINAYEKSAKDIVAVQRWLGHSCLNTTQIYLNNLQTAPAASLSSKLSLPRFPAVVAA